MSQYRFAVNSRWTDLPHCSAVLHGHPRDYVVADYKTTLSIKTVLRGSAWYEMPQGRYRVTPDTFLILNERQQYSMKVSADSNTETFCPFFQPGFVKREFYERLYPMSGPVGQTISAIGSVPLEDSFYDLAGALAELRGAGIGIFIFAAPLRAATLIGFSGIVSPCGLSNRWRKLLGTGKSAEIGAPAS